MAGAGRPTRYSEDLADRLCAEISTSTVGLHRILAEDTFWPAERTVYGWMKDVPGFREKIEVAKAEQMEHLIYSSRAGLEEVDVEDKDFGANRLGKAKALAEHSLRMAAKIAPRKFGDKVGIEHSGAVSFTDLIAKAEKE